MATTLRNGALLDAPPTDLGILIQAKSRVGSHISVTAFGKYPPRVADKLLPTVCEDRRIMPANVPLCFREVGEVAGLPPKLEILGED